MGWPFRVTKPLVDVLQALLRADGPIHGWRLAEVTRQSGPNVYRALRRLQDAAWVDCRWVDSPEAGRPRRRLYWLTPAGQRGAAQLLNERAGATFDSRFGGRP
jgi:PadR family transcriptional regulator, regulatory protein PadR